MGSGVGHGDWRWLWGTDMVYWAMGDWHWLWGLEYTGMGNEVWHWLWGTIIVYGGLTWAIVD
jgi:hypothetical protein